MIILYISIFVGSLVLLYWSGSRLIKALSKICHMLGWREFVVAFFVMSMATSIPNLFVDVNAALKNIPQLAFGDVIGGNIVDLTLVIGLAVVLSRVSVPAESKMVQSSALFTIAVAVLPLLFISDGKITRTDGALLVLAFVFYSIWLFSNKGRFTKSYVSFKSARKPGSKIAKIISSGLKVAFFAGMLVLASEGIILSAQYFSNFMGLSLSLVGILIVGFGNCAPEMYFTAISARNGQNWMILGNIMGSVIVTTTLVLGIVAFIRPFEITDFSPFLIARAFTVVSAVLFFVVLRTGKKITKLEGLALISIYFAFLLTEVYFK